MKVLGQQHDRNECLPCVDSCKLSLKAVLLRCRNDYHLGPVVHADRTEKFYYRMHDLVKPSSMINIEGFSLLRYNAL
jgi:hypothetical protein